jgi:hypothetical protein
LETGREGTAELQAELRKHVGTEIGPIARPDEIRCSDAFPKPAVEKSCGGFCVLSPLVKRSPETPAPSKIAPCSIDYGLKNRSWADLTSPLANGLCKAADHLDPFWVIRPCAKQAPA